METNNQLVENIQEAKKLLSPLAKVTDNFFTTPTIGLISKAIAEAQTSLEKVLKNTNNSFFKSKYADLASVIDVTREFANHGVAITQHPGFINGKVEVTTLLSHLSGEAIGSRLEMTPVDSKPQTIGATITYARRYALAACTNVAQEDDDGNTASGRSDQGNKQQPQQQPQKQNAPQQNVSQPQNTNKPAQTNTVPQQQSQQKTAEEQLMAEKKVRLEKLPGMIAQNEWFALDAVSSPKFGKPNGKAGMQEIVKFVCNSKERVDPASMTIEQIDEVLRLANYICEYFKKGGQPGAGPADVWIGNMHKALNNPEQKEAGKYDMF